MKTQYTPRVDAIVYGAAIGFSDAELLALAFAALDQAAAPRELVRQIEALATEAGAFHVDTCESCDAAAPCGRAECHRAAHDALRGEAVADFDR